MITTVSAKSVASPSQQKPDERPTEHLLQLAQATLENMRALNRIGQDLTSQTDSEELLEHASSYLNDTLCYAGATIVPRNAGYETEGRKFEENQRRIVVPVRFDREVLADIVIPQEETRPLGEVELEILEHFSRFLAIAIGRIKRLEAANALASIDPVTGIMNRRRLIDIGERELTQTASTGVIVFDIDYFKEINDEHGHQAGDEVLRSVARRATECIRKTDFIARYGGDEFAILLPDTRLQTAIEIAERVRANIESSGAGPHDQTIHATVSVGLACVEGQLDLSVLIGRADQALYAAKRSGRNLVCYHAAREESCGESASQHAPRQVCSIGVRLLNPQFRDRLRIRNSEFGVCPEIGD